MSRGFYTAASGVLTQQRTINVIANNIANVRTAGYKKDTLETTTFDDFLVSKYEKINATNDSTVKNLSQASFVRYADSLYTDYEQGPIEETGNPFNICIYGDGFFTLSDPNAEQSENVGEGEGDGENATATANTILTRRGEFALDDEGYLSVPGVGRLMGMDGPIQVGTSEFEVTQGGAVFVDGNYIDTIKMTYPKDVHSLVKYQEGFFLDTDPENQTTGIIEGELKQNYVEGSNVEITKEITDMMASSKLYQSCTQIIKMYDTLNQKAISEVSRV